MNTAKMVWQVQRGVAHLVAPALKATGFRFSKAWRGNRIVDHIAANNIADGDAPYPIADFVWPQKAPRRAVRRVTQ